jgi:hypothetical protein
MKVRVRISAAVLSPGEGVGQFQGCRQVSARSSNEKV